MDYRAIDTPEPDGDRGPGLSRVLLDTTFLVDADREGGDWEGILADDDDAAIAAITVAELRVGVALSTGRAKHKRQDFVEDVLITIPVVDYDRAVAEAHADLLLVVRRQGRPRGAHDLIIAASARATDREVVTADAKGFADLPQVRVRRHR